MTTDKYDGLEVLELEDLCKLKDNLEKTLDDIEVLIEKKIK